MIYTLEKSHYDKVRPLCKGFDHTLIVTAVIEKMCPGTIYVDDVNNPEIALIVSPEGYYLVGNHKNDEFNKELRKLLDDVIIPQKIKEGEENISLNYYPERWEDIISVLFQDIYPVKVQGYTYVFDQVTIDWREKIPPGFSLVRIDENLLKTDLKNSKKVVEWTQTTWNSPKEFLEYGFGFCVVHGDTIVSWCIADCVSGTRCEIGIETDEDYRRRGFATITVAATVEYCLQHTFTHIGWHTGVTNTGSIKTAESAGFKRVLMDTYYFFWFYPVDNFIEHGFFSWLGKQYKESAQWYERALAVAESGENYNSFQLSKYHSVHSVYVYAACSWAQAGRKDLSFNNLKKAARIAKDPQHFAEQLQRSESLKSLRGTDEWDALLSSLQQ